MKGLKDVQAKSRKLEEFYEKDLTVREGNTLSNERPYYNQQEAKFFKHFTEESTDCISLMKERPLSITTRAKISSVEKPCMRNQGVPFDPGSGLRIPNENYFQNKRVQGRQRDDDSEPGRVQRSN